jgi:uncharacterized protein involved in exopolysaccharide biosynthesis
MKFTLRDVLNVVFRYSRALIIFWVVVLIAAIVFYSQTGKLYQSKAKILVSLGTESLGKAAYADTKNLQLLQREEQIHNEQQILESHEVALTVAKWLAEDQTPGSPAPQMDARIRKAQRFLSGAEPAPTLVLRITQSIAKLFARKPAPDDAHAAQIKNMAQQISDGLSVKAIFDSDALDVQFTYRNPEVAQTILDLVIHAYLQHHIAVFQSADEASLLKGQLDQSVNNYHQRLGDFSSYMSAHHVYNDDTQVSVLMEQREKLKQALDEATADSDAAEARMASLKSVQNSLHDYERYSTVEVRNQVRQTLRLRLDEASLEERSLLARHPKESRAYQEEEAKLDEIRHLVDQEPETVVEQTEQRKTKAGEFVDTELISLAETERGDIARVNRLRQDLGNIEAEIAHYASDLKGFSSLKMDLNMAKLESEQMSQLYTDSRLRSMTSQNAITNISIIDRPTFEPDPASPSKLLALAATIVLLLLGSFALLFACIGLDTTVADSTTAKLRLGVPVIGSLPVLRGEAEDREFTDKFIRSNYAEFARIYQILRAPSAEGKIILLAESGTREGGSLVGYSLAKFLSSYAHEKTAFIDHTPNSLTANPGVNQPAILDWHQVTGPENGLDAADALSKLRPDYQYIVVSTGAVKDTTDLLRLSGIVTIALFIVEAAGTRRATARYNLDLLRQYGFKRVQLILNKRVFYIPAWLMRFV